MTTKQAPSVVFLRDVHDIPAAEAMAADDSLVAEMRANIQAGDAYIARGFATREELAPIREYLTRVGQGSLPNYCPIGRGAPNFHRMNDWDERAYVKGCFHQFTFFPWNQDLFGLFRRFASIYHLKNRLSGLAPERFLGTEPDEDCTARLSFQFYPRGSGALNKHTDPVDHHQLTVPTMTLSQKGEDFRAGGAYAERADGTRVIFDDISGWGDVVFFHAQAPHGVEPIDPEAELSWASFQGRWLLLFAVNKLAGTDRVGDSVDLG